MKEIHLSMQSRLALEKQVKELETTIRTLHEEIHTLKQDKKVIKKNSEKWEKMVYGNNNRSSKMSARVVTTPNSAAFS